MLNNIFAMGGYEVYVWSAYTLVGCFLFFQWLIPWKRWKRSIKNLDHKLFNDDKINE